MGVPSTQQHLGRSVRQSAMRRFMQRLSLAASDPAGDVVNKETTAAGGIFTDVDGATVTFDMSVYRLHTVVLGGNRTLAVANVAYQVNQRFAIRLVQDNTGSRTVSWWTTIKWVGGSAPTLTTAGNKADWFGFVTTGNGTYDGFVIGQNL